ncbi:MAG: hypothetical protein AAF456_13890 [Planctomycetota bacterium]
MRTINDANAVVFVLSSIAEFDACDGRAVAVTGDVKINVPAVTIRTKSN